MRSHVCPTEWVVFIQSIFAIQVAILVDDMIDTGRTLSLAVRTLHENGARAIYALISHGLLSEVNMSMIETLPLERLVVRTPHRNLHFLCKV